ncbi:hypothetical protein HGRIS_001492 [Hohenbuehelia grisea]|uniref:Uncharacterized protein n=1 Tax=Hohenbuehelia grisea TaxID=104357 RepID=A0ABR3JQH4_9AGAR
MLGSHRLSLASIFSTFGRARQPASHHQSEHQSQQQQQPQDRDRDREKERGKKRHQHERDWEKERPRERSGSGVRRLGLARAGAVGRQIGVGVEASGLRGTTLTTLTP